MNHFAKIAAQLESRDLDGMLLTHEANRFYASGFHSAGTDGMALVTREKFYYFTDSRYTEAARRHWKQKKRLKNWMKAMQWKQKQWRQQNQQIWKK